MPSLSRYTKFPFNFDADFFQLVSIFGIIEKDEWNNFEFFKKQITFSNLYCEFKGIILVAVQFLFIKHMKYMRTVKFPFTIYVMFAWFDTVRR